MCRMIAKASVANTSIMDEMLSCPQSLKYLSTQGRLPENPSQRGNHNDGCGIAFISNGETVVHKRGMKDAWDESYIDLVSSSFSKLFVAHNRLASAGLDAHIDGSHPFELHAQGVDYAFSHNGTIYDFVPEAKQRNTSDSFLFLENLISSTESNSEEQIMSRLRLLINQCDYSSMTGFLLSPEKLIVWRVFNEKIKEKQDDYELYYTMFMKLTEKAVVFSSEPLDNDNWALLSNNSYVSVEPQETGLKMHYGFF